jgi:hypothetical protein
VITFLAGPVVALLPKPWRDRFNLTPGEWKIAGVTSGALEALAAFAALVEWYSRSVTHWAQDAIVSTIAAHPQAAIPPDAQGFAALLLLLFYPVTWLIIYCGLEGTVRLLAAGINGTIFGVLPLYLLERCCAILFSRRSRWHLKSRNGSEIDALLLRNDAEGEILEIRAVLPKEGWLPPKIVRFRGTYYRLFQAYEERSTRHYFVYALRRLSAGVHSWTVIDYSADVRWMDSGESEPIN